VDGQGLEDAELHRPLAMLVNLIARGSVVKHVAQLRVVAVHLQVLQQAIRQRIIAVLLLLHHVLDIIPAPRIHRVHHAGQLLLPITGKDTQLLSLRMVVLVQTVKATQPPMGLVAVPPIQLLAVLDLVTPSLATLNLDAEEHGTPLLECAVVLLLQ